ncbi:MAG: histidinol-phosphate transaminase [Alistipes sp.]|jgi:histidinol-phosphate aminotransferase|nr:histidinol-phosphate transaminase [Alistipes sp.]
MKNPLDLVRRNILALTPYSTARDEYQGGPLGVFLDANENPYPSAENFNRYPDPGQKEIKGLLAGIKGVAAERIFIGNGSDEAIDLCFRVFCEPRTDNAIAIAPSYGMYRVAAATNDVEMREVRLGNPACAENPDFALDTEAVLAAADEHSKLLFLCSPNNPSGNLLPRAQIVELLERFPGMVVVDEAYIDFADRGPDGSEPGFLGDLEKHPNLIVLQTLSKAWGMAGLRLGLAFGAREVMDIFARVKYPYNISSAVQAIVAERLRAPEKVAAQIAEIRSERARVAAALAASPAIAHVFPSDANFVLVRTTGDARALYEKLIAGGIIVRDRSRIAGCEGTLRITVGTPEENDKLIKQIQ